MKKILSLLLCLSISQVAYAQTVSNDLIGLGMPPEQADYIAGILPAGSTLGNNTYLKGRNQANSADINMMKLDSSDNLVINSNASDELILQLEDDASRLISLTAASDTVLSMKFGDAGTTAAQTFYIGASTSDADDDSVTFLTGGGGKTADGTRGATLAMYGNESTGSGKADLVLGATANFRVIGNSGAEVPLTVSGASGGRVSVTGIGFPTANFEVVAGAGTTVADAAALSATDNVHQLTGANGTVGWKFATSVAGQFEILLNTTAGVPKIYAASGGTCNGGGANVACTLVTGIVAHLCYSTAVNTWICS